VPSAWKPAACRAVYPGGPVLGRNYAWYAYLAEDHASRACSPAWANYLRHVETLHEDPGKVTRTVTFTPFFPRQITLCVYLNNPARERSVVERVVDIPAAYGRQRSSGYNCDASERAESGSAAATSVPPPAGLSTSRRPPSAVTRSPIPTSP
jgi:hypothetical protein